MGNEFLSSSVYSDMQTGQPLKVYKKTILARVFVQVLNPFSGMPEGIILSGNHLKNDEGCFVLVWSDKEDTFFKKANKNQFKGGYITQIAVEDYLKATGQEEKIQIDYNKLSDKQLKELVTSPFLKFKRELEKFTTETPLLRMLDIAESLKKSEKILNPIRERLNKVQVGNI